jgi:hypothetical protein
VSSCPGAGRTLARNCSASSSAAGSIQRSEPVALIIVKATGDVDFVGYDSATQ